MTYSLRGATVLVTGGAGLIGSHIVDRLIDKGASEIRVLDNLVRGRLDNLRQAKARYPIRFLQGDVRDQAAVMKAVSGCDFVFHQPPSASPSALKGRACIEVLVLGTFNVFEAAVRAGVRKIVYASSASVYGSADTFPTDERHPPYNNRTLYGAAKLMNEGLARSFHDSYGLASVGLRYFNVYGPRMDVTGAYTEVFVRWLECAATGQPPEIHGDGSTTMDCVYVGDVARANILALESDCQDDVFNIASGEETSLMKLWRAIQEVTGGHHVQPKFLPPRTVNPVPRRLADTRLARERLGFVAEVSLHDGLVQLAAHRRQQQGLSQRKAPARIPT